MIHEVDEAIRRLVVRDAIEGNGVDVSFEAPTKEWASKRNAPTLNVYLYDIREDVGRREVAFERTLDDDGRVVSRAPPPRRFALSYLVTAWTQRSVDEHRLLSDVLATFLRFDALPLDVLTDQLAAQPGAVLIDVALPPPEDRSIADLWSALGGELKPSLDLVVTAPFATAREMGVDRVVEERRLALAPRADRRPRGKRGTGDSRVDDTG